MLPLWPNQLLVSLGAYHVSLIYRSGVLKKVLSQQEVTVQADVTTSWRGCMQALSQLLDELALPAGVELKLNLASEFVRYLVLPAVDMHMAKGEKQAYAMAAYREIFGAESQGWMVKCDDAHPAMPTLCAAIDQALWDALAAMMQSHRLHMCSIQPYFIRAINALSYDVKHSNGVVVVVEQSRLMVASVRDGSITQVRAQTHAAGWQQDLPDMLARMALLDEDLGKDMLVYAPNAKSSVLNPIKDWKIKRIGTFAKRTSLPSAYAMLEVMA